MRLKWPRDEEPKLIGVQSAAESATNASNPSPRTKRSKRPAASTCSVQASLKKRPSGVQSPGDISPVTSSPGAMAPLRHFSAQSLYGTHVSSIVYSPLSPAEAPLTMMKPRREEAGRVRHAVPGSAPSHASLEASSPQSRSRRTIRGASDGERTETERSAGPPSYAKLQTSSATPLVATQSPSPSVPAAGALHSRLPA